MAFRYKITNHRPRKVDFNTGGYTTGEVENLVGSVQNKPASDLEERFARGLDKLQIEYYFRERITSPFAGRRRLTSVQRNLVGEIEIDYLVTKALVTPIFIDGAISHFQTKWQQEIDAEKTRQTNEFGKIFGWAEAIRIPFWQLANQDQTDTLVRQMFS